MCSALRAHTGGKDQYTGARGRGEERRIWEGFKGEATSKRGLQGGEEWDLEEENVTAGAPGLRGGGGGYGVFSKATSICSICGHGASV